VRVVQSSAARPSGTARCADGPSSSTRALLSTACRTGSAHASGPVDVGPRAIDTPPAYPGWHDPDAAEGPQRKTCKSPPRRRRGDGPCRGARHPRHRRRDHPGRRGRRRHAVCTPLVEYSVPRNSLRVIRLAQGEDRNRPISVASGRVCRLTWITSPVDQSLEAERFAVHRSSGHGPRPTGLDKPVRLRLIVALVTLL
jgi:hypothetical protein